MANQTAHNSTQLEKVKRNIRLDSTPRWIRVKFNGETIADSKNVIVLHERGHLPVYYFPEADVRTDLLEQTEQSTFCPLKGDASYWTITTGDRSSENAVWSYPNPIPESKGIRGYYAFYWNKVDAWYEEEEQIFVHPRDPYKRVDAIASSRHIQIKLNGEWVADSKRPVIVFETGVPVRYYLPREDVRFDLLKASASQTSCPYKGDAVYWTADVNGEVYKDILWSYPNPIPEIPKIAGLVSFYNEKTEVFVDGEREAEPKWYKSALDFFNASEIKLNE
ncbi:DUF427 domain-containing protein [Paenibacillus sp. YAF4_2]|uniref:DUF427 domain-containing protein n=1 Tax=Paenibacillus sp. YAF4_2 TaxID=3233085 RepID=UPI003F97C922